MQSRIVVRVTLSWLSVVMIERINFGFSFEGITTFLIFLDSSMVEHSAVNRVVVGSSPTRGAGCFFFEAFVIFLFYMVR